MSESTPQYTVLARRFRPKSFEEVVGQGHVGQAIQNAIRTGRVAHAYMFTGARGVGKTSTARIFAKALNCPNVVNAEPCNQCEICRGIAAGNDVDVLEIDGASNRGIDDIRQLRANVSIRSMRSANKVYIIDEVHMLTKEAFNALLKTLEEPPPNVKFVFCTTEPNKVPDTILSRCQRFDFGTIAQASIADRLRQIATAEGKQVDDDAVEFVARRAAGSMRDSQSLFDQLLAFGGEQITAADVHQLLGTAPDERLIELVEAMIANRPDVALASIESTLERGGQIGSLSDQLLAYLRDLLVTAAGAQDVALSAVTESSRPQVADQAKRWGLQTISAAMQILVETKGRMQRASFGRALLELAIVRMASLEQLDQIAALVQRAASGGGAAVPVSPRPGPAAPVKKNFDASPAPAREAPPPPPMSPAVPAATPQPKAHIPLTEENLGQIWERLLPEIPDKLGEHLNNNSRRAIAGPNRLEISFPRSYLFSKSYCESAESVKKLGLALHQLIGLPVDCRFTIDETSDVAVKPSPRVERAATVERRKASSVDGDPFVQLAAGIFGGQVVEVRPVLQPVMTSVSEHDLNDTEEDDDDLDS